MISADAIGIGALLQLALWLIALRQPPMRISGLWETEFALPMTMFAWGAHHMVARNRR